MTCAEEPLSNRSTIYPNRAGNDILKYIDVSKLGGKHVVTTFTKASP